MRIIVRMEIIRLFLLITMGNIFVAVVICLAYAFPELGEPNISGIKLSLFESIIYVFRVGSIVLFSTAYLMYCLCLEKKYHIALYGAIVAPVSSIAIFGSIFDLYDIIKLLLLGVTSVVPLIFFNEYVRTRTGESTGHS